MRAVKSVLVMAGSLRRQEPDLSEEVLLIRAMRDRYFFFTTKNFYLSIFTLSIIDLFVFGGSK
jgi:hypothetical protein